MPVSVDDVQRTIEFRQRLVAYMSKVLESDPRTYGGGLNSDTRHELAEEQPGLAQEYGRLYNVINRWGTTGMGSPAFGMSTRDVVLDAIHDVGDSFYPDIARIAQQHLDTVIGRLQAELASSGRTADTLYRITSPLYWLRVLGSGLVALWGSTRGRIVTVLGALLLAVISAVVSGAAKAFVDAWLSRQ
jgi:hypothetical protein